ncbi:hypothetical protein SAMN03159444_01916 [Pseudomonas sp. NFACC02]|uniref:hypothetical protein n=1 Tax=Pseudomonas sp. NFACC02 TaxID=1566250 RepID=UPI0008B6286E|nr:hypothetical protein [Pseudomonas sp. NFACC02]SEQ54973.1 hypothetical protein SAMN03159444_01916 [Pseudomonas sp. NFACC02]
MISTPSGALLRIYLGMAHLIQNPTAELTLVYGIGTDYGQAMVRRYLADEGLGNIQIYCGKVPPVATQGLLGQIDDSGFDIGALRESGPAAGDITPYLETCLASLTPMQRNEAIAFCRSIGKQLLRNYLNTQVQTKGWDMWADERLEKCALGMHGLGLTHAFGHYRSQGDASSSLGARSGRVERQNDRLDSAFPELVRLQHWHHRTHTGP